MKRRAAVAPALPGFESVITPSAPLAPQVSSRRCYPPRRDPRSRYYRYRLELDFEGRAPAHRLLVCMVNPSKADEEKDDPTVGRVIARAWRLGFGGLDIGNLFGIRSTDPDLRNFGDPIGPENDGELARMARRSSGMLFAWGNNGLYEGRAGVAGSALARIAAAAPDPAFAHCWRCARQIQRGAGFCGRDCAIEAPAAMRTSGIPIWCFKVTKEGQPAHPLYQRDDAVLQPWVPPPVICQCAVQRRGRGMTAVAPAASAGAVHIWRSRLHTLPGCLLCRAPPAEALQPCRGAR